MQLTKENTSRKIDSLGRVSIPKSMRDRLGLAEGEEVEFYLLADGDDRYVCLTNHRKDTARYRMAAEVLEELDLEIPDILANKI